MPPPVFIDTDILIDFGQDIPEAIQTIAALEEEFDFYISVIVAMELQAGCRSKKDLEKIDDFLSDFKITFITQHVSEKAFELMREYRSSHGVEINDMIIAATAISYDAEFISKNQKHYRFLSELKLLNYPWNGA